MSNAKRFPPDVKESQRRHLRELHDRYYIRTQEKEREAEWQARVAELQAKRSSTKPEEK